MHPLIEAHRSELLALARRHGMRSIMMFGSMDVDVVTVASLHPLLRERVLREAQAL